MRALGLVTVLLLAGCTGPAAPDPGTDGWSRIEGLDSVWFRGTAEPCERTCLLHAEVENRGSATYGIYDDCAAQWRRWSITTPDGETLPYTGVACALCSTPQPFPPGARRTLDWVWHGREPGPFNEAPAEPGRYVATLTVTIDNGTGQRNLCDGHFASGSMSLDVDLP